MGSLLVEPDHSLVEQSHSARERAVPLNGDGFGVAWYAPQAETEEPATFRSISPAWSNQNLLSLARVIDSPCILAHVRAASPGLPVMENNCHPFTAGRFAFMHNGVVGGFAQLRRRLLERLSDEAFNAIQGSTDSEHVLGLFLDRMAQQDHEDPAPALGAALAATVDDVVELVRDHGGEEPSTLNLAVSDGRVAAVTRFISGSQEEPNSLYVNRGRRYLCKGGACSMESSVEEGEAVLVTSEPLSAEAGWDPVPPNHLLVIDANRSLRLTALG